jgi:hypothetical protein
VALEPAPQALAGAEDALEAEAGLRAEDVAAAGGGMDRRDVEAAYAAERAARPGGGGCGAGGGAGPLGAVAVEPAAVAGSRPAGVARPPGLLAHRRHPQPPCRSYEQVRICCRELLAQRGGRK